ncbi:MULTISPECIES: hypothetical protein [unclassified Frankia]|uniref:hypothetical protein n=1 Tax=unclassified Frankia TaxID=2632575 RepID=UPI001EF3FD4D|nr:MULTISPECIES: hypothetical protein [unclassified Frankia]
MLDVDKQKITLSTHWMHVRKTGLEGARIRAIGDLVDAANARQTIRDALAAVQQQVANAETVYADARKAALEAGWTSKELVSLGYPQPVQCRRQRNSATDSSEPADDTGTIAEESDRAPKTVAPHQPGQ